jgi:orotate phosphoribosyltransferase
MVNNGMLRFGDFILKSGRKSPYLIHSGYNRIGSQMSKLGEFYAECIKEQGIESNCLIGINEREVPLIIATSMTLFNKYGIDSHYCVDDSMENESFSSREITLITDAFTSGSSLCEALDRIRAHMGKYPSAIVVCVDRMEHSEHTSFSAKNEIERRYGVKIYPIVNAEDILRAIESGVITAGDHYEAFKEYLKHYRGN